MTENLIVFKSKALSSNSENVVRKWDFEINLFTDLKIMHYSAQSQCT